jgi:RNA methyltransferase, TrmH family
LFFIFAPATKAHVLIETVISRQNPLVKRFIAARLGRERRLLFVEGVRLVEEAVRSGLGVEAVAYGRRLLDTERGRALLETLKTLSCRGAFLSDALLKTVCDVETSQGVALLARRPHYDLDPLSAPAPLLVFADGLQDPGNVGALIRTAEAAGAGGFITARGSADPFQVKSLRAAAGAAFRLPVVAGQPRAAVIAFLRAAGIRIVAADARASIHFAEYDWRQPVALWLGSEGNGLAAGADEMADAKVFIPMSGAAESLNVTVAASLILYEAFRRRTAP